MNQIIIRDTNQKEFSVFFVNILLVFLQILLLHELVSAEVTLKLQKVRVQTLIFFLVLGQTVRLDQVTRGEYFCAMIARPASTVADFNRLLLVSSFCVELQK